MEKNNEGIELSAENIEGTEVETVASEPISKAETTEEPLSEIITRDFDSFSRAYPNISREALINDDSFAIFVEGKEGKSLTDLYSQYGKMVANIEKNAIMREQIRQQNAKSAVGALSGEANPTEGYFTKEQVQKMTPAEIKRNYTKIRESQARW